MEYIIVKSNDIRNLQMNVVEKLAEGWEPQGGVFTYYEHTRLNSDMHGGLIRFEPIIIFGQALVRREENE